MRVVSQEEEIRRGEKFLRKVNLTNSYISGFKLKTLIIIFCISVFLGGIKIFLRVDRTIALATSLMATASGYLLYTNIKLIKESGFSINIFSNSKLFNQFILVLKLLFCLLFFLLGFFAGF
jgi:hypothetical protein